MARARLPLLPTPVKRLVQLLAVLFIVIYVVLPQIPGVRRSLSLLAGIDLRLAALAVLLEVGSVLCYTNLTRSVLPRGGSPPFFTLLRVQLSTLALSHVVPGGSAAGGALGYQLLTRLGIRGTDAAFAMAAQGMGSAVVLNMLLWLALLVSIPLRGFHPLYGTAALLGALLLGAVAALVLLLMRGEARATAVLRSVARRLPLLEEQRVESVVLRLAERLRALARDRRLVARALVWDLGFWLLTATALWVWLGAFGAWLPLDGLFVAFGLAYVVAAIPITPMGLGLVEGVLIPLLTLFGAPRGAATLGVLLYRLVNFWLPIPVGALAYLSLPTGDRSEPGERDAATAPRGR